MKGRGGTAFLAHADCSFCTLIEAGLIGYRRSGTSHIILALTKAAQRNLPKRLAKLKHSLTSPAQYFTLPNVGFQSNGWLSGVASGSGLQILIVLSASPTINLKPV